MHWNNDCYSKLLRYRSPTSDANQWPIGSGKLRQVGGNPMPHVAVNWSNRVLATAPLAVMCSALLMTGGSKPAAKTTQSSRVASSEPVASGDAQPCDMSHLNVWI